MPIIPVSDNNLTKVELPSFALNSNLKILPELVSEYFLKAIGCEPRPVPKGWSRKFLHATVKLLYNTKLELFTFFIEKSSKTANP